MTDVLMSEMPTTTKAPRKIKMREIKTVKSISSFSLCSMHCFQMLNCRDDCLALDESPKFVMLPKILELILLRSETSIKKNDWNVYER